MGNTLLNLNELEKAIDCYRKAIKIDPSYPKAYNNMGQSLFAMGRFEEAIECFCKVIDIDPHYDLAFDNLMLAVEEQKDLSRLQEAMVFLESFFGRHKENMKAQQCLESLRSKMDQKWTNNFNSMILRINYKIMEGAPQIEK